MDKKSDVRVVGFPKENYDKEWLDTLNDKQKSEECYKNYIIYDIGKWYSSHWWYFLHD